MSGRDESVEDRLIGELERAERAWRLADTRANELDVKLRRLDPPVRPDQAAATFRTACGLECKAAVPWPPTRYYVRAVRTAAVRTLGPLDSLENTAPAMRERRYELREYSATQRTCLYVEVVP